VEPRWLLLFHHIPPKPPYLRVKIWRRLGRLGAVCLKNSVYALPSSDESREDFEWVAREIVQSGGESTVCAAQLLEGLTDVAVEQLFRASREADFKEVSESARALKAKASRKPRAQVRAELADAVARLRKRFSEVVNVDFFNAPGREVAEGLVADLEVSLTQAELGEASKEAWPKPALRGGTWVTRKDIHVDRMGSAWLIRKFIDPDAKLRFVDLKDYRHKQGELRFDMFDAEYTHEGDACTFEVLLSRFNLRQHSLQLIGEMIHDIDVKDGKFGRPETAGLERFVAGVVLAHSRDDARLERASALFDDLYLALERGTGESANPTPGAKRRKKPTTRRNF
jgi:hypothetical protein